MEKQEFCMEKSQIFQEMISRISKLSQDSYLMVTDMQHNLTFVPESTAEFLGNCIIVRHQPAAGPQRREQRAHQRQIDHRGLVHDHRVRLQRLLFVFCKGHIARLLVPASEQAVE